MRVKADSRHGVGNGGDGEPSLKWVLLLALIAAISLLSVLVKLTAEACQ